MEGKFCPIDFEFNSSNEKVLNLVSCSYQVGGRPPESLWLKDNQENKDKLKKYLCRLNELGYIFVSYGATAEARCLLALGLDPNDFKWTCLYFMHRQLTHTYHKFKYGRYYKTTGILRRSVPPHYDPNRNIGKDNNEVGMGYAAAVAVHFGAHIDSTHKDNMRDLILLNKPKYSEDEKTQIMEYCESDIRWLMKLLDSSVKAISEVTGLDENSILKTWVNLSDYAASLAKMESEGTPLDVTSTINLRNNYDTAKDAIIEQLNEVYPFYELEKKSKEFRGSYKKKYSLFEKFINESDLIDEKAWPLSDSGKYKSDEKTLDKYLGIPEIKAYKDANKLMGQMKWFQLPDITKPDAKDFFDNVGGDDKLRAFLGGFGTLSGRNAPKAKTFVLAMSSWLRCLVRTKKGEAIVGIDYASQEFIIAAVMSGDQSMIAAYDSGDPYLYFAKKAKTVPEDANPKWCKNPSLAPEGERGDYLKYQIQRDLAKALVLGLQYGLGVANLAIKLTADSGRFVSEDEARKLLNLHKKTFPVYWRWLDKVEYEYKCNKYIMLKDGWCLLPNNDNGLSVKNFPVQGTGAVIMRRAVALATRKGIRLITPLHDAIYAIFNEVTEKDTPKILSECMQQAVEDVLGKGVIVRQDIDIHDSDHVWIEKKGEKYYKLLSKYLEKMETAIDVDKKLSETLFKPLT